MKNQLKSIIIAAALAAVSFGASAAEDSYKIDVWHTTTTFSVLHNGTSTNTGKFPTKEGLVTFDKQKQTGSVDLTIDVAGLATGVPLFDEHLRSEKWLNTAKNPTANFKSTKFDVVGDKVVGVYGDLTLNGVTKPVHLLATNFNCYDNKMFKTEACGGDFETTIERGDFGITTGLDMGMPSEVKLAIQVEALKLVSEPNKAEK